MLSLKSKYFVKWHLNVLNTWYATWLLSLKVCIPPPPPLPFPHPSPNPERTVCTRDLRGMLENHPWRHCIFGQEVAWLAHSMNSIIFNSDLFTCTTWADFVRLNFQHIGIRKKKKTTTTQSRHVSLFICFSVQNTPRPGFSVVHG